MMPDSTGFDWMSLIKILAPAATSLAGGALAGDPNQQRKPFTGSVAPQKLLEEYMNSLNGVGNTLVTRLNKPSGLTKGSVAQQMPGFATDPAMGDPSILTGKGYGLPEGLFPDFKSSGNRLASGTAGAPASQDQGATPAERKVRLRSKAYAGYTDNGLDQGLAEHRGPNGQGGAGIQELLNYMLKNRKKKPADDPATPTDTEGGK